MALVVPKDAQIHDITPVSSGPFSWKSQPVPLFAGEVNIAQTQQGTIGDCFILASLVAILSRKEGNTFISNMMLEEGDKVVVRLYGRGDGDVVYLRTRKGQILRDGAAVAARGCCWVDVLEACLSVFQMKAKQNSNDVGRPDLANIDNGQAHFAMQQILGGEGMCSQVISPKFDGSASKAIQERHAGVAFVNFILDLNKLSGPNSKADEVGLFKQMIGSDLRYHEYINWLRQHEHRLVLQWRRYVRGEKAYSAVVRNVIGGRAVPISIRQDGFEQFIDANFDPKFVEPIKNFSRSAFGGSSTLFPGRRSDLGKNGKCQYSVDEDNLFNGVRECLDNGWPVVLSSNEWVGVPEGRGFSSDEAMSKGLVGGHAYAVSGIAPGANAKRLILTNPWGKYVRRFDTGTGKPYGSDSATDTSKGVMGLDVRTISKHFEYYAFSKKNLA